MPTKTVVKLFGNLYDITDFIENGHPGRLNPQQCHNMDDCTALFVSIHNTHTIDTLFKTGNFQRLIKHIGPPFLPAIQHQPRYEDYMPDWYRELKQTVLRTIVTRGMISRARRRIILTSTFQLLLYLLSGYAILGRLLDEQQRHQSLSGFSVCLLVCFGMYCAQTSAVFHGACHGSFASSPRVELYLTSFGEFIGGLSTFQWKREHNIIHHQFTNQNEDAQYHQAPLLRYSRNDSYHWRYRYQHMYAWLIYAFISLNLKSGAIFRFSVRNEGYLSGCTVGIIAIALFHLGLSIYLGVIFIPNHYVGHCDVSATSQWPKEQVLTSANFHSGNVIWNWFSAGLNHQIEHHLIPNLPYTLYPAISTYVQKVCNDQGIEYKNNSLVGALVSHYQVLSECGKQ